MTTPTPAGDPGPTPTGAPTGDRPMSAVERGWRFDAAQTFAHVGDPAVREARLRRFQEDVVGRRHVRDYERAELTRQRRRATTEQRNAMRATRDADRASRLEAAVADYVAKPDRVDEVAFRHDVSPQALAFELKARKLMRRPGGYHRRRCASTAVCVHYPPCGSSPLYPLADVPIR